MGIFYHLTSCIIVLSISGVPVVSLAVMDDMVEYGEEEALPLADDEKTPEKDALYYAELGHAKSQVSGGLSVLL